MQKLKLLPWLARRQGVSLERAEELWRQAIALADFAHGTNARSTQASDYWAYAMRTLLMLLRCDGVALIDADQLEQPHAALVSRSAVPLIDSQRRLGAAAVDAAEAFLHAANDYWSRALHVVDARR
jgi:histidine ammonia-lyase